MRCSTLLFAAGLASALAVVGCRSALRASDAAPAMAKENARARGLLCSDIGHEGCVAACPDNQPFREHVDCLIRHRFGADPDAVELAAALFAKLGIVPGLVAIPEIEAYKGETVALHPALPMGEDRHHLEWVTASFEQYEAWMAKMTPHAASPISFQARPDSFLFFRTAGRTYPSAYAMDGAISYNLDGPLHTSAADVHDTLFHELFHLNDQLRGDWSNAALAPIYERILDRCGKDHDCFGRFAPHDTVVEDGTYYAFDERTRNVKEYAAELALRYYREHAAALEGSPMDPPFKCLADENLEAWTLLSEAFFGGADLSRPCG